MTIVYAKHEPYGDGHLEEVLAQMQMLGAPTIRAVRHDHDLIALEGSHRLAAAQILGIKPIFVEVHAELPDLRHLDGLPSFWERAKAGLPVYDVTGSPLFDAFRFFAD